MAQIARLAVKEPFYEFGRISKTRRGFFFEEFLWIFFYRLNKKRVSSPVFHFVRSALFFLLAVYFVSTSRRLLCFSFVKDALFI